MAYFLIAEHDGSFVSDNLTGVPVLLDVTDSTSDTVDEWTIRHYTGGGEAMDNTVIDGVLILSDQRERNLNLPLRRVQDRAALVWRGKINPLTGVGEVSIHAFGYSTTPLTYWNALALNVALRSIKVGSTYQWILHAGTGGTPPASVTLTTDPTEYHEYMLTLDGNTATITVDGGAEVKSITDPIVGTIRQTMETVFVSHRGQAGSTDLCETYLDYLKIFVDTGLGSKFVEDLEITFQPEIEDANIGRLFPITWYLDKIEPGDVITDENGIRGFPFPHDVVKATIAAEYTGIGHKSDLDDAFEIFFTGYASGNSSQTREFARLVLPRGQHDYFIEENFDFVPYSKGGRILQPTFSTAYAVNVRHWGLGTDESAKGVMATLWISPWDENTFFMTWNFETMAVPSISFVDGFRGFPFEVEIIGVSFAARELEGTSQLPDKDSYLFEGRFQLMYGPKYAEPISELRSTPFNITWEDLNLNSSWHNPLIWFPYESSFNTQTIPVDSLMGVNMEMLTGNLISKGSISLWCRY